MDNQHRQIKGYRELSQDEINLINTIKQAGIDLSVLVATLQEMPETDKRWVAIGRTDLQTGLMALTRAVAQPIFF